MRYSSKNLLFIYAILLGINIALPAGADSVFNGSSWLRDSEVDWSKSRSKSDVQRLAEEARKGDVKAMRRLGIISMKGIKVKPSAKIAINWWKKAADKGDAHAMMYLGDVYKAGNGVRKDVKRALQYYTDALKTAERQSNTDDDKQLIIKRIKKMPLSISIDWWRERCEQGDMNAMYYLGTLKKEQGDNVLSDEDVANYLIMAAKAGHSKAKKKIENAPREQYLAYWDEGEKSGTTTEVNTEEAENPVKQDIHNSAKLSTLQRSKTEELIEAAGNGAYWKFEELIRQGADINYKDEKSSYSAFAEAAFAACRNGDLEGLKILAKYNPDIYDCCSKDKRSIFTALKYSESAYVGRVYYALLDLVDFASIPNGKLSSLFPDKRSPLVEAALRGFTSCVSKMLINGVSADDCQDGITRPTLHCMIMALANRSAFRASDSDEFVNCFNLILSKADLNYISIEEEGGRKRYRTPLVVALEYRLFSIATRLINEGADVNACLYGQVNALGEFLREKSRNNDIVEYLVQAGAHVENDPEGKELLKKYEKAWYWYQKKHP